VRTVDDEMRLPPREADPGGDAPDRPAERPRLRDDRRFLVGLGIVALVALAVRAWWVLAGYDHYKVNGDALYYHLQAWALADGKGFINPFDWYERGREVQLAANPPLYSLYLAVVSKLGFWSVTEHRLASGLLGTGGVVMIGIVARQIGSNRAGLIAAGVAAVYPNLWINDGMLLSEPMTVLCMPIVLYAAYAFWRRPEVSRAVGLGLALGFAALTRGEVVFLAPLLVLPLLYGLRRLSIRERLKLLVITAACMVAVIGPWVGYNLSRFEKPVFMTDHWGTVLKAASCDEAWYGEYRGWYWFCQKTQPPGDYSERDAILRDEALDYTRARLDDLPGVMAARVGRLWEVYRPRQTIEFNAGWEGRTQDASVAAFWSYWVMLPLAVGGLFVLKRRKLPISPIVAPAITVTIAAATTYGVLRYRVSVEPGFVVAVAIALDALWSRFGGRPATDVQAAPPAGAAPPTAPEVAGARR
jgi:4-amino-4-deoxy-L-arabinose transferase-like glycosyltransferase